MMPIASQTTPVRSGKMMSHRAVDSWSTDNQKIQDFCEALQINSDDKGLKKFEVRSNLNDIAEEAGNVADRKWSQSRIGATSARGNSKQRHFSASSRVRQGVKQTAGVLSGRRGKTPPPGGVLLKENRPRVIDLSNSKDVLELAMKLYNEELGIGCGKDKQMRKYLTHFQNADLTFPEMWSREDLFEKVNEETLQREELFLPSIENKESACCLSKSSTRVCDKYRNTTSKLGLRTFVEPVYSDSATFRQPFTNAKASTARFETRKDKQINRRPMALSTNKGVQKMKELGYYGKRMGTNPLAMQRWQLTHTRPLQS